MLIFLCRTGDGVQPELFKRIIARLTAFLEVLCPKSFFVTPSRSSPSGCNQNRAFVWFMAPDPAMVGTACLQGRHQFRWIPAASRCLAPWLASVCGLPFSWSYRYCRHVLLAEIQACQTQNLSILGHI